MAPSGSGTDNKPYRGHGFAYFAVGGRTSDFDDLLGAGGGDGIGLLSLNPSYHFADRHTPRKLVPFVTGGNSLAFRSGTLSLFNYGGGATYWLSKRIGLRLKERDHRRGGSFASFFRAGLTFR